MNCVIYTRVSSKEQEAEGFSIPAQQKLLKEYAKSHKLNIVREFSDVETAKSTGRSKFGEMVAYLKENRGVRIVLVEKTDRLYRNFKDCVRLEELDLAIHLVKENEIISKDSRSHAKLVHGLKVVIAKNYSDNLSEEVKKGMREKAEQGEYPAKAPVGYLNDKAARVVVQDPKYSPMVVRAFLLYAAGDHSLMQVQSTLKAEGWRTPSGRVFSKSMIEMVLKNPIYFGEFEWNGARYLGTHQPLISREVFDTVQSVLTGGRTSRFRKLDFLFKGFLKCDACGCAIVAERKKQKYVYYHCTHARGECNQPWVKEETLEAQMAAVFRAIEIDRDIVAEIVKALKEGHHDEQIFRASESARLKKRFDELQGRLDKAYEDRLNGVIDERYWREVTAKWRTEQDSFREQLNRLDRAGRNYVDEATEVLELSQRAYTLYLKQNATEKRQLLKTVLSNCTLDGVTLNPTYKKPFNYIAEGVILHGKLPRLDSNQRPVD